MTRAFPAEPTQTDPSFGVTLVARIRALLARDQTGAVELLLPTLENFSGMAENAIAIRAEIALARADRNLAMKILDHGLQNFPASFDLLILRSALAFLERNFAVAAETAAESVCIRPDSAEAKSLLGRALLKLGRVEQAAPCLREACAGMPAHVPTRLALSRAMPEEAETILQAGIESNPESIALRNALIRVFLDRNELELARATLNPMIGAGGGDADTYLLAIETAARSTDWVEAAHLCDAPQLSRLANA